MAAMAAMVLTLGMVVKGIGAETVVPVVMAAAVLVQALVHVVPMAALAA